MERKQAGYERPNSLLTHYTHNAGGNGIGSHNPHQIGSAGKRRYIQIGGMLATIKLANRNLHQQTAQSVEHHHLDIARH